MNDVEKTKEDKQPARSARKRVPLWIWPMGLAAAGLGTAAAILLRGCWHRNMSWPIREGEYAYQTCNECGIKRLFDEKRFRPYGPYGYHLDELIRGHERRRSERVKRAGGKEPAEEDFVI